MKVLIIDSHKGVKHTIPQNMHWQNAKILADAFNADLIWSYPTVNDDIKTGYDVIIFVHASHYAYTDYEWITKNPNAELYYVTNEYNLGEPRTLWMAAKEGRKYNVIANHPHEASKVVMKYVKEWYNVNLNALIFNPSPVLENPFFNFERQGAIYYGSFRKDRAPYFTKYLDENIILSTHSKNVPKFRDIGVRSTAINRIDWKRGLGDYKHSLYIEDVKTHTHYNHLANRFYEALNDGCTPIFGEECRRTVELSGYDIPDEYFINSSEQLKDKSCLDPKEQWFEMALYEKNTTLKQIRSIIRKEICVTPK